MPTVPVWQARNGHARAARILGREAATGWGSGHNAPATSAGSLARHRISPRWARPKITRSGGDWQGSSYGLIEVTSATTTIPSRNHEMTSASVDSGNPVLRPKTETPSRQGARHVGRLGRGPTLTATALVGSRRGGQRTLLTSGVDIRVDKEVGESGARTAPRHRNRRAPAPDRPQDRPAPHESRHPGNGGPGRRDKGGGALGGASGDEGPRPAGGGGRASH